MADDAADPAAREELRQSGLRVDREGRLWHRGAPVEHRGLRAAIFRWLDRLPDGRHVVRLDPVRFAYVDVEDTPLVGEGLRWADGVPVLALSDGSEEALVPETAGLNVDATGVLRCAVRGGRLEARLSTWAASALADHLEEVDGALWLKHSDGRRTPIQQRP